MRVNSRGRLVILSGPSGVGKDTVIDAWRKRNPRVHRVVAYTTRPPRPGEVDGVDYHFVSEPRFKHLAEQGAFLEHKEVHGNFYATPLTDMEAMLDEGHIAILKIDVQGAISAMELRPDAITIFILPPSWQDLERRIQFRGTDSDEVIARRLQDAHAEMSLADRYQYRIYNDRITSAVDRLEAIFKQAEAAP